MLLSSEHSQVFREYRVAVDEAERVAGEAVDAARTVRKQGVGCAAWAVHLSHDRRRVITVEAWQDPAAFHRSGGHGDLVRYRPDTVLYQRVATGGVDPTPVGGPSPGVVVIDVFTVWRPLVRAVSRFNVRNGRAFNRHAGCVSTTVLRGSTAGRIATYARWRSTEDFLAAFTAAQGTAVDSTDAVNDATARMSHGLIRTDYHTYDLLDADGALQ